MVGDPGPDGVRIDKDGVFANFFLAKRSGKRPAILLLGGSEGGLQPGGGGPIGPLIAEGYDVLYLCYFGCPGTPPQLANVPLETFDRGLAFLRAQPGVDPKRIAIVGGSKGAEAALLVASRDPKLKAVVAGMPSSVAWPGIVNSQAHAAQLDHPRRAGSVRSLRLRLLRQGRHLRPLQRGLADPAAAPRGGDSGSSGSAAPFC